VFDVAAIPLALYVHLPWCERKCPYCDFNSYERDGPLPQRAYVAALLADLAADASYVAGRTIGSIFIGGGTPSLFEGAVLADLLAGIRRRVPIAPDAEVTLEANPGTADAANFAAYRRAGVNRLSLGVQSLRDEALQRLGRVHDARQARAAVALAREVGFTNFNLDLMHGLPDEDADAALQDLADALELAPTHLSWYQLTLEAGTAFARRPPRLPAHDDIALAFDAGCELLGRAGYERYEVSAFARPGRISRHNLNYWEFGDYLGIGAGAHGKVTTADGILRTVKRRHPKAYQACAGSASGAQVEPSAGAQLVTEFVLNALRLPRGFTRELFSSRTGLPAHALDRGIGDGIARGWLHDDGSRVMPSALGLRFLTDLQLLFVA
jgi:putative oxygen-independent coproporphyrinogen III oxidase